MSFLPPYDLSERGPCDKIDIVVAGLRKATNARLALASNLRPA